MPVNRLEHIVLTSLAMMRTFLIVTVLLLALCACVGPSGQGRTEGSGAAVTGKVTDHRQPVAGVRISAYPATAMTLENDAQYETVSDAEGRFRLQLPAGDYYLLARGESFFAYYGRNPLAVPDGGVTDVNIGLVGSIDQRPEVTPFVETGVAGRLFADGRPLAGATVYLYTDLTGSLKGMGYAMAGPTGADGYFEVAVPAGTYYLVARQRQSGAGVGPLRAGDFMGYYPNNPIRVSAGQVAKVAVPMLEVPEKVDALQGALFGENSIRGHILDAEGKPVAGARAMLYDDPQMFNRPLYVSAPTGADGAYVLSFPHPGTYYLAARDTLGGAPGPGELYGTWDGTSDHSLEVDKGQALTGLDIVVEEMW
jgi:hypothetical protein